MRYDARDLFPFVQAAKLGSFSAAARTMQITPSAVSKAVGRLESSLGTRLFNRNTRFLQLTDVGTSFFESMSEAVDRIDSAVAAVTEAKRGPMGTIRVSTITSFGKFFLIPLVKEFQRLYPAVNLEIQFDDGTPGLVSDGFDIAIRRGIPKGASTVTRLLATLPLVLVASPEYLSEHGTPDTPEALLTHDCVSIRFPSGKYARWRFRLRDANSDSGPVQTHFPKGRLVVSEQPVDVLIDSARMGVGIVAIAASFVLPYLRDRSLKVVLANYEIEKETEVYLQYPHKDHLAPKVRVFADFLIERLKLDERLQITHKSLRSYSSS